MTAPENAFAPAEHRLTRVLGLPEAVALGVGGTIGGGIFVLVGAAAGEAGPGALLSFGLAFLASLLIALPYAELACRFPLAGGGYAVAHAVLGRRWGFLMGWGYWGAYLAVSGYVTLGFGGYLDNLIGLPTAVGAVALVTSCTAVNLAGVRLSARVQALVVLLAAAALLGFGLLGLPHVELDRFTPAFPQGPSGVLTGALLAFLAFGGFDMVAAAGEEIAEPDRNLPLAILLTLVAVLGLYLLVAIVALGVLPWNQLGASSAPLSDAASEFAGGTGRTGVAVAALLTTAATANAVLVVTSRIAFAMARDGLLPSAVARVDPRTGATRGAILLSGALLAAVALAGSIDLAAATPPAPPSAHPSPPSSFPSPSPPPSPSSSPAAAPASCSVAPGSRSASPPTPRSPVDPGIRTQAIGRATIDAPCSQCSGIEIMRSVASAHACDSGAGAGIAETDHQTRGDGSSVCRGGICCAGGAFCDVTGQIVDGP